MAVLEEDMETSRVLRANPLGAGFANSAERCLQSRLKRALDIAVAVAGLIVLSPVFCLIALAIWINDFGNPIFLQPRTGKDGRIFLIWKFRTMRLASETEPQRQTDGGDDPRITWIGQFLRRSNLDELPQLVNVLNGEMSLVGPRPHPLFMDDYYGDVLIGYPGRWAVLPGITGAAQIGGSRGPVNSDGEMQERLDMDLDYIEGWTFGRDIRLLLATIFSRKGYYQAF